MAALSPLAEEWIELCACWWYPVIGLYPSTLQCYSIWERISITPPNWISSFGSSRTLWRRQICKRYMYRPTKLKLEVEQIPAPVSAYNFYRSRRMSSKRASTTTKCACVHHSLVPRAEKAIDVVDNVAASVLHGATWRLALQAFVCPAELSQTRDPRFGLEVAPLFLWNEDLKHLRTRNAKVKSGKDSGDWHGAKLSRRPHNRVSSTSGSASTARCTSRGEEAFLKPSCGF